MSQPWMKFYPTDWRADPALRMCSIGARGLWMEMLCVMHEATPRGTLSVNGRTVTSRQLASLAGSSIDEVESCLQELEEAGVFSRADDGTIYSRRMQRDDEKATRDKANGGLGGNPKLKGVNPPVMGEDKAQKPEARDQKEPSSDFEVKSSEGERAAPQPDKPAKRVKISKATRLNPDWQPSADDVAYATAQGMPEAALTREVEKFRNHWLSTGTKNAAKLDWAATWRNWVLRSCEMKGYAPVAATSEAAKPQAPPGMVFVEEASKDWLVCANNHKKLKGRWPSPQKFDGGMGWYFPAEYLQQQDAAA